jgi:hypothetical protein
MNDDSLPLRGLVLVEERSVYGQRMLYPANALARALLQLTRGSTFTAVQVERVKAIGLQVRTTGAASREL